MIRHSSVRFRVAALLIVFFAASFLLQACREGDSRLYLLAAAVPGGMLLFLLLPARLFALDRPSLSAALALCGLGILAPAALRPDLALEQGIRCAASLFLLAAGAVLVRSCRPSFPVAVAAACCGWAALALPLFLLPKTFSLSECGLVLVFLSVSMFLSLRSRLPALMVSAGGCLLLLLTRNAGTAAVCGLISVLLFWAVSGSGFWAGASAVLFAGGITAALCVPFVPAEDSSSSMLSLLAGCPLILPEADGAADPAALDSLFLLLGQQYGFIILCCAVLLLGWILLRGASLAVHARKAFHAALALAAILLLGLRALAFLLSLSGWIPVPSGHFPFLSQEFPELFAHFFLLGILSGVSARNEADLEEDRRLAMLAR